ncbi:hypothetical protein B0T11DRAFT_296375 [Plectosphaerella cucumerina]|uniref:Uncharacterized protein n=1 Tax=Plectosphaerella cucumerina TaxID=40658 RepID=A0A8K0TLX3_9PEZI|nr:hypothetical protein B0T11DRAFT_296375 [Plectosphaerella cucumerina]
MGIVKKSTDRLESRAAKKGIKRHRRDDARDAKLQRERDDRYFAHCNAANALRGQRWLAEFVAATAQADMGPRDQDVDMANLEDDAAPAKTYDKKEGKANRFRFKTFPSILTAAFPKGFIDNYRNPGEASFFPLWDAEVVASLRLALDFGSSIPKSGKRLQVYIFTLFEAALKVKAKNPTFLPAGKLVVPADRVAFFDLVSHTMSRHINAGGLPSYRYNLSIFVLGHIIDGMAAARQAYRDASPSSKVEGSQKELYVVRLVDRWIESFGGGQFLLQDLVFKSHDLITAAFRPATE